MSTVETTTRYATTVTHLADAWAFVMAHVDQVGPHPHIMIKPLWSKLDADMGDGEPWDHALEVSVEGTVETIRTDFRDC